MTGSKLGVGFIGSGFVASFISTAGAEFATPMCWACTVQTPRAPKRLPHGRESCASVTRAPSTRSKRWLLRQNSFRFFFSEQNWNFHGPVEYRVSHGDIYYHGGRTTWTDEDLLDTGMTAKPPSLSVLV